MKYLILLVLSLSCVACAVTTIPNPDIDTEDGVSKTKVSNFPELVLCSTHFDSGLAVTTCQRS